MTSSKKTNQKPPIKGKVPLGKPLHWSDKDLDKLSEITPEDIEEAKAFWRKHAPPESADLLDAKVIKGTEKKKKPTQ